jgi:hypothetical protein
MAPASVVAVVEGAPGGRALAAQLFALERRRTQALVARDIATARALHATHYQLVTPAGKAFDREAYLDAVASGALAYAAWDCGPMQARLGADMALLRYRARITFESGRSVDCWHTDSYERHGDGWLAAWSQATAVVAAPG